MGLGRALYVLYHSKKSRTARKNPWAWKSLKSTFIISKFKYSKKNLYKKAKNPPKAVNQPWISIFLELPDDLPGHNLKLLLYSEKSMHFNNTSILKNCIFRISF